ncbi:MAG TPA: GFA family protein [Alphaproteobacteria bacterium]|nr:GFA family protein [Alphaproteobacteria bacterium]
MATPMPLEGGCLCGSVRYRISLEPHHTGHCHCSMCRRAGGAPVVTWITLKEQGLAVTKGTPSWYQSSDHGRRAFCPSCGTPLFFTSTRYAGYVDVTAGSLDHPERVTPDRHVYAPDRIPWLIMNDGLPRHVGDSRSPLVAER